MDNTLKTWLPIVGFESLYEVSSDGEIKSLPKKYVRSNGIPDSKKEMVLSLIDNGNGYKCVTLCGNGKNKRVYIHQIVATAFIPNPENYSEVNHKDGDKSNNCVSNLEWSNRSLNNSHAWKTGLNKGYDKSGNNNPRYKNGKKTRIDVEKSCEECGSPFVAKFITTRFCSFLCSGRNKVKMMNIIKSNPCS
jgi:hypothetical protein